MKKVNYQITIDCSREKVFSIMLDKEHYSTWTAEFNPTSHYEGTWKEGSDILFLGETEHGEEAGMQSKIEKLEPNKFISIKHLAMLDKGIETFFDEALYEKYTFEDSENGTLLKVEMDSEDAWFDYFENTWPKALQKLKEVCEQHC